MELWMFHISMSRLVQGEHISLWRPLVSKDLKNDKLSAEYNLEDPKSKWQKHLQCFFDQQLYDHHSWSSIFAMFIHFETFHPPLSSIIVSHDLRWCFRPTQQHKALHSQPSIEPLGNWICWASWKVSGSKGTAVSVSLPVVFEIKSGGWSVVACPWKDLYIYTYTAYPLAPQFVDVVASELNDTRKYWVH